MIIIRENRLLRLLILTVSFFVVTLATQLGKNQRERHIKNISNM